MTNNLYKAQYAPTKKETQRGESELVGGHLPSTGPVSCLDIKYSQSQTSNAFLLAKLTGWTLLTTSLY